MASHMISPWFGKECAAIPCLPHLARAFTLRMQSGQRRTQPRSSRFSPRSRSLLHSCQCGVVVSSQVSLSTGVIIGLQLTSRMSCPLMTGRCHKAYFTDAEHSAPDCHSTGSTIRCICSGLGIIRPLLMLGSSRSKSTSLIIVGLSILSFWFLSYYSFSYDSFD